MFKELFVEYEFFKFLGLLNMSCHIVIKKYLLYILESLKHDLKNEKYC